MDTEKCEPQINVYSLDCAGERLKELHQYLGIHISLTLGWMLCIYYLWIYISRSGIHTQWHNDHTLSFCFL